MSAQFGKCNFDGKPVNPADLDEVRPVLAPYGPDGEGFICNDNFGILFRALHTTKESRRELQPYTLSETAILTWDGRLDNREELSDLLASDCASQTDLEIVAAAYERWGTSTFSKLVGDWALSLWDPKNRSLLLAKDFLGTRPLFYAIDKDQIKWCTILDPLIRFESPAFELEEEYIAGWITGFPATHLTPYCGIYSVPPSSYVRLKGSTASITRYWDFDPSLRIRYRKDEEYEEHFRYAFTEAVRRRLRSDSPILAELSGGMDSSSIVCVADVLTRPENSAAPKIDTVSYYDESEPNWDERPYFTIVERHLGRTGIHIDVGGELERTLELDALHFAPTPSSVKFSGKASSAFSECLISRQSRVLLSGVGGDEFTGGIPMPKPELQDLIASFRVDLLAHKLKTWALALRRPFLHLLLDAAKGFLIASGNNLGVKELRCWLDPRFATRNALALRGYDRRIHLFGALPSLQQNLQNFEGLKRQLGCTPLASQPACELRYPYLDRNLLEFLFGLPREQLVRPGQRRSLMRRALAGIVPDEILNRKRKAFVTRSSAITVSDQWDWLTREKRSFLLADARIVRPQSLEKALSQLRSGQEIPVVTLMRILACECWLRTASQHIAMPSNKSLPLTSGWAISKPDLPLRGSAS